MKTAWFYTFILAATSAALYFLAPYHWFWRRSLVIQDAKFVGASAVVCAVIAGLGYFIPKTARLQATRYFWWPVTLVAVIPSLLTFVLAWAPLYGICTRKTYAMLHTSAHQGSAILVAVALFVSLVAWLEHRNSKFRRPACRHEDYVPGECGPECGC